MYIKIKRAPCAFQQTGEYERVHITHFLTDLVSEDRKELDDDTLFALHRYLSSGRAPKGSLELSGLDGLLTAVITSRDGAGILEWMPVVWGGGEGGEPVFEDLAEAECIFAAINRRYRQIQDDLASEGPPLLILRRSLDDEILAGAWCRGFLRGVWLLVRQSTPAIHSVEGQKILFPISIVAGNETLYRVFCSRGTDEPWDRSANIVMTRWHPFSPEAFLDFWADWRFRVGNGGTKEVLRRIREQIESRAS